jgi:hypothetical protein
MAAQVKVIGLDTAKHVFQVHGADTSGRVVLRKRLRRNQLADYFANLPRCLVGLEATRGAHYWARVLASFGHDVKLIARQFVKPYLKGQKNDAQDTAAICEAVGRPEMRFVPPKSIGQQDLQALHRIRSRLIGSRTGQKAPVQESPYSRLKIPDRGIAARSSCQEGRSVKGNRHAGFYGDEAGRSEHAGHQPTDPGTTARRCASTCWSLKRHPTTACAWRRRASWTHKNRIWKTG